MGEGGFVGEWSGVLVGGGGGGEGQSGHPFSLIPILSEYSPMRLLCFREKAVNSDCRTQPPGKKIQCEEQNFSSVDRLSLF